MLRTRVFPREVKRYSPWHPVMPFAVGLILKMQIARQEVFLIIQVWAKSHMIQRMYVWFMPEILFYTPLLTHLIAKHCISTCVGGQDSFTTHSKGEASVVLDWYLVLEQWKMLCQSQEAGMTVNWCHLCSGFQSLSVTRY